MDLLSWVDELRLGLLEFLGLGFVEMEVTMHMEAMWG